jgi:general stress protein 26
MEKEQIIATAQELVRKGGTFVFATVDAQGVPQMRWMGGCFFEEPMTIYLAATADSRKMVQLAVNPQAQLMFHAPDYAQVVSLWGRAEAVDCQDTKRKVLEGIPGAQGYFASADDPKFGVIKFICSRIEAIGLAEGMTPVTAEL